MDPANKHAYSSPEELARRRRFVEQFNACPVPDADLLRNLGLFLNRQSLARILFMHDLYRRIINVHGIVVEFGVRYGQNMALFSCFRGMYEPYNLNRLIVGFDTFDGFPATSAEDGDSELAAAGAYGVPANYETYLRDLLAYHESESPLAHIRKTELIKGDVTQTLPAYLNEHPETIVALAYFDLDLYEPTKKCLEAIRPHITRGSVLAFDELNCREFPGETQAVREILGLDRYKIRRTPHNPTPSFVVID